jgi:hypothetical protein
MRTLWILLQALQPTHNTPIFEVISIALSEVSQWVWGLVASFVGSVYFAYEDNGWSLKRKIWVVFAGLVFGFALGYGVTKWLELTYWSYIVHGICGVLGFNIAGGFRTLSIRFKKDPLKTANDLNDLRRNIQNFANNEESTNNNDDKRNDGPDNNSVEPK